MKKTKIIATIGPKSSSYETMESLVKEGMDIIRLNMSHGTYTTEMAKVENIKKINLKLSTNVAVLLDTKGPEVRTGLFENGEITLVKDSYVTIVMNEILGTNKKFNVSYKGLANDLKINDIILLDDGYVSLKVVEIKNNELYCLVLNNGTLKDRRGVNVPGITLNFDFMSQKDRDDIIWACENNFDFIAASFVRNANDVKIIQNVIKETRNTNIKIISKIESKDGVLNLDEIINISDGIMIARGDLGVEIPAEEVPVVQKRIIKKCNAIGKIVVTATQMLESMQTNPRPTRAEVSDVFNAVIDGTDAVMLSGETANGEYPIEAVRTQTNIAIAAEKVFNYGSYSRQIHRTLEPTLEKLIAFSAVTTADKLDNVKLIIAPTESGNTPRTISQMKPRQPILALTSNIYVSHSLSANFGVYRK